MDELIGRLASKAGIDSAVAEKTVGIVLGFLRNEGPSDKVQALIDQIPGAEAAIAASSSNGGFSADGRRSNGGGHQADGAWSGHERDSRRGTRTFQVRPRQNRSGSNGQDHFGDDGAQPVRLNTPFG